MECVGGRGWLLLHCTVPQTDHGTSKVLCSPGLLDWIVVSTQLMTQISLSCLSQTHSMPASAIPPACCCIFSIRHRWCYVLQTSIANYALPPTSPKWPSFSRSANEAGASKQSTDTCWPSQQLQWRQSVPFLLRRCFAQKWDRAWTTVQLMHCVSYARTRPYIARLISETLTVACDNWVMCSD